MGGDPMDGHGDEISAATVSHNGRWLALNCKDGTVSLWDLAAANPLSTRRVLSPNEGKLDPVEFSPDDQWILITTDAQSRNWTNSQSLWKFDPAPVLVATLYGKDGHSESSDTIFSADGRWVTSLVTTCMPVCGALR
jgi:WD40 repeat protein